MPVQPFVAQFYAWIDVATDPFVQHCQQETFAHSDVPTLTSGAPKLQRLEGRYDRDVGDEDTILEKRLGSAGEGEDFLRRLRAAFAEAVIEPVGGGIDRHVTTGQVHETFHADLVAVLQIRDVRCPGFAVGRLTNRFHVVAAHIQLRQLFCGARHRRPHHRSQQPLIGLVAILNHEAVWNSVL